MAVPSVPSNRAAIMRYHHRMRPPRPNRSSAPTRAAEGGDNRRRTSNETKSDGTRRRKHHPGKRERAAIKARQRTPHEFDDATRGIRIQKAMAQAGVGSKRA